MKPASLTIWSLCGVGILVFTASYQSGARSAAASDLRECVTALAAERDEAQDITEDFAGVVHINNEMVDWCLERLETCEALLSLDEAIDRFEEEGAADG